MLLLCLRTPSLSPSLLVKCKVSKQGLLGTGRRRGGGGGEGVWREIIYLSLRCHHRNDFRIKTGSDESHFNVSLIVRDKVTRQCPQTTTSEQKGEPKRIRTEVPLLTSTTPYRYAKPAHTFVCLERS